MNKNTIKRRLSLNFSKIIIVQLLSSQEISQKRQFSLRHTGYTRYTKFRPEYASVKSSAHHCFPPTGNNNIPKRGSRIEEYSFPFINASKPSCSPKIDVAGNRSPDGSLTSYVKLSEVIYTMSRDCIMAYDYV